jgi:hypothetical protein
VEIQDSLGQQRRRRVDAPGEEGHTGKLLQDHRVVDRLGWRRAPGEGSMTGNQDHGVGSWIDAGKGIGDLYTGFGFVVPGDLFIGYVGRAGDGTVGIIRVRGSQAGQVLPGLGPGSCMGRVGVHDTTDTWEIPVEMGVGAGVRRGLQDSFDDPVLEVHHHDRLGGQLVIRHAGGFDDHQTALWVVS